MNTSWRNVFNKHCFTQQYVIIKKFLTDEECNNVELLTQNIPNVDGNIDGKVYLKIRSSEIKWIWFSESSEWLFERLDSVLTYVNENFYNFNLFGYDFIQYSNYDAKKDGHYDVHADMLYESTNLDNALTRKLSACILLNDNFKGGDFELYFSSNAKIVELSKGSLIVFPSWVLHKVAPVTEGSRNSLVVWVLGPKFV
jgi:PKHD-type hydroxylase